MELHIAKDIAEDLLAEHGLYNWAVRFDNAKRRAGMCSYGDKVISLSRLLTKERTDAEVMNTITHEVAHALTQGHGHGRVWQRKHRELGGDGQTCTQTKFVDKSAPWVGRCGHGKEYTRYRKPPGHLRYACRCAAGATPVVFEQVR